MGGKLAVSDLPPQLLDEVAGLPGWGPDQPAERPVCRDGSRASRQPPGEGPGQRRDSSVLRPVADGEGAGRRRAVRPGSRSAGPFCRASAGHVLFCARLQMARGPAVAGPSGLRAGLPDRSAGPAGLGAGLPGQGGKLHSRNSIS